MKKDLKPKEQEEQRSVILYRIANDNAKSVQERLYQPAEGSPFANIKTLCEALDGLYDMLILHDTKESCLLVEVKKKKVSEIDCRLHHK